jgi:hypothetical protein
MQRQVAVVETSAKNTAQRIDVEKAAIEGAAHKFYQKLTPVGNLPLQGDTLVWERRHLFQTVARLRAGIETLNMVLFMASIGKHAKII